jgi:REP element-mobilizing transposase RayT
MKKRHQQLKFTDPRMKNMLQFGGSLLKKSNAKTARPISTKHAMHIVLKSSLAKGEWSLLSPKNQKMVDKALRTLTKKYGIKIYEFANVGNHLHLLIKLNNRFTFKPFIRALAGCIALKVTGANKFKGLKHKFWDYRPWSRIVEWKKAYTMAKDYVIQNHLEAIGLIPYQTRNYKKHFKRELTT